MCAYFADAFRRARTPNPCVVCNPRVKFRALIDYADELGAPYIATGHYARTGRDAQGRALLLRAGAAKDQSYMLCRLTPEQAGRLQGLDALLVPVGGYYTIDAGQAKALVDALRPRVVVPMHYRSDTFGYDVLAPLEDYLALCRDVVRYPGNTLELTAGTPAQTAVLRYCP